jgi:hypothetical protein
MRTFSDRTGRVWTVDVNTWSIERVKGLTKVNLLDLADGQTIARLMTSPILLVNVIWCLIKPEADALGISDEDFGRAMAGDAIDQATTALLEDLADFFPNPRQREGIHLVMSRYRATQDQLVEMVIEELPQKLADSEQEARTRARALLSTISKSSTASPAMSASTPAP